LTKQKDIDSKPDPYQLLQYIGKKGRIDLTRTEIIGKTGTVKINNSVADPGSTFIHLYSGNKFQKTIEYETEIPLGVNEIHFDTSNTKLLPGKYTCHVEVEDRAKDKIKVKLPKTLEIDITGVDIPKNQIIASNGDRYNASLVQEIQGISSKTSSLIEASAFYLGKKVEFTNDKFSYDRDDGTPYSIAFKIDPPKPGYQIGGAELKIFDESGQVGSVLKAADELYASNVEPIPTYNLLDSQSKKEVDEYIRTNLRLPGIYEYKDLTDPSHQLIISNHIEEQFRSGNYYRNMQEHNHKNKLKNMGLVQIEWNGILSNGKTAKTGTEFRYEIHTTTIDANTNQQTSNMITNHNLSLVKNAYVENDEIILHLSDGSIIPANKAIQIAS